MPARSGEYPGTKIYGAVGTYAGTVVLCGLLAGLSALWMTLFYPRPVGDGDFLSALRLLFGSAMISSIVLGFTTIRRGDVTRHRAWMMRGYAIGLARARRR